LIAHGSGLVLPAKAQKGSRQYGFLSNAFTYTPSRTSVPEAVCLLHFWLSLRRGPAANTSLICPTVITLVYTTGKTFQHQVHGSTPFFCFESSSPLPFRPLPSHPMCTAGQASV
ncbi:unnamed protein product, partial [Laminaria digitata]